MNVGKWEYFISQEDDNDFRWALAYDYDDQYVFSSKSYSTFKAAKSAALKQMKKMLTQFASLIKKAAKEKE